MENRPFEEVFRIKHGDIPASHVRLPEGTKFDQLQEYYFWEVENMIFEIDRVLWLVLHLRFKMTKADR